MVIDLVEFLTPSEDATMSVQIENDVSLSYILPCIRGLDSKLSLFESDYHSKFIETLYSSLLRRMEPYETSKLTELQLLLILALNYAGVEQDQRNRITRLF